MSPPRSSWPGPSLLVSIVVGLALTSCGPPPSGLGRSGDRGAAERDASLTLLVLPDDGGGALLDAMAGARRRVWMEMYLLTDDGALGALQVARSAGADVRVLLEPAPYGDETANQGALATLARAGVDVRWFAVPGGLVHAKVILVDDAAWISTANLTNAGLNRNRELMAVDTDPADVRRVESSWQTDAVGWPGPAMPGAPPGAEDNGNQARETRVIASPDDARARLTAAVESAVSTIDLAVEELSDTDFMGRLIAARARGVQVSVVVPTGGDRSAATTAAAMRLASGGIDVRATGGPTLHAKGMTVDGRVAYLGSVNFTRASLDDNREVGLLFEAQTMVSRIHDTIHHDGASGAPLP